MSEPIQRGTMQHPKAEYTRAMMLIPNGVAVRVVGQQVTLDRGIPAEVLEITDGPLAGTFVAVEKPVIAKAAATPPAE